MNDERIAKMLKLHELWLRGDPEGVRAVFSGEDFSECNIEGADPGIHHFITRREAEMYE